MSEFLGFWIITLAITGFVVFVFGWEIDIKSKVLIIIGFQIFIGLLEIGLFLMSID